MSFSARQGFTLIELMIVVAIVAILAAVAYPSYLDSVRKSRRAEAISTLEDVRLNQAKWRANNATYGTQANMGLSSPHNLTYYTIAVTSNTATAFTVTAVPISGTSQASDSACPGFAINQNGPALYGTQTAAQMRTCWSR